MKSKVLIAAIASLFICFGMSVIYSNAAQVGVSVDTEYTSGLDYYSEYDGISISSKQIASWENKDGIKLAYEIVTVKNNNDVIATYEGIAVTGLPSNIFDVVCQDISLDIPDSLDTDTYPEINGVKFIEAKVTQNTYLKSVDLTGVEVLMDTAFANATYIENVTIPESVKVIGKNIFLNSGLKTVTINSKLKTIPTGFAQNTPLTTVNLKYPEYLISVGDNAFSKTSIKTFPDNCVNLQSIEKQAFQNCKELSVFPFENTSLIYIGVGAFQNCSSLKNLTAPQTLWGIDQTSFNGCTSLSSVVFNDSLDSIGGSAFQGCTSLVEVKGIPNTVHDWTPADKSAGENYGTGFGAGVFQGCTSLQKIELPDSLTVVPDNICSGCTSLVSVSGKGSIVTIGKNSFSNCINLVEVYFPFVSTVSDGAFNGCTSLSNLEIPKLSIVGKNSFNKCTSLVDIPNSIVSIDTNGFMDCTSIKELELLNCEIIESYAFKGCTALTKFTGRASKYGTSVFNGCTALAEADIDWSLVNEVPDNFFSGCKSLVTVHNTKDISVIGNSAFLGCTSLQSFWGENVRIVKNSAFKDCTSLTSFGAKRNESGYWTLHDVGANAFENCVSMKDAGYFDSSTFGTSAFKNSGITALYLANQDSAVIINDTAFSDCVNLKTIEMHCSSDNVTLGKSIFSNCTSLESVEYSAVTVPANAFTKCTKLNTFNFVIDTTGVKFSIGDNAFNGSGLEYLLTDGEDNTILASVGNSAFYGTNIHKTYSDSNTVFSGTANYYGTKVESALDLNLLSTNMFSNCSELKEVSTSVSLIEVPASCFVNCSSLTKFNNLGSGFDGIRIINSSAFANTVIEEVVLRDTQTIKDSAFTNSKIKVLDVTGTLGTKSFYNCTNLEEVTIGSDVVPNNCFTNCTSLRDVKWTVTPSTIKSGAFANCSVLTDLYIPGNPTLESTVVTAKTENLMLFGDSEDGSVASYASSNGIPFSVYTDAVIKTRIVEKSRKGDVNANGLITVTDVVAMHKWLHGSNDVSVVAKNMDLNGDSICNIYDLILLKRLLINNS